MEKWNSNVPKLSGQVHLKKQESKSRFIQTTPDVLAKQVQSVCLGC